MAPRQFSTRVRSPASTIKVRAQSRLKKMAEMAAVEIRANTNIGDPLRGSRNPGELRRSVHVRRRGQGYTVGYFDVDHATFYEQGTIEKRESRNAPYGREIVNGKKRGGSPAHHAVDRAANKVRRVPR